MTTAARGEHRTGSRRAPAGPAKVVDEGHARIHNDWQTQTHGLLMGLMARLMDIERGHSQAMQKGFSGMETHIAAVRASSPSWPPSG